MHIDFTDDEDTLSRRIQFGYEHRGLDKTGVSIGHQATKECIQIMDTRHPSIAANTSPFSVQDMGNSFREKTDPVIP